MNDQQQTSLLPAPSKKSVPTWLIAILAPIYLFGGTIAAIFATFTVAGAEVYKNSYAGAVILLLMLGAAWLIGALGFTRKMSVVLSSITAIILLGYGLLTLLAMSSGTNYKFLSQPPNVIAWFAIALVAVLPVMTMSIYEAWRTGSVRRIRTVIGLSTVVPIALLAFAVFQQTVSEARYQKEKNAFENHLSDNERQARESSQDDKEQQAQAANDRKNIEAAAESVVRSLDQSVKANGQAPKKLAAPTGYETADYMIHPGNSNSEVMICIKPTNIDNYYLGITIQFNTSGVMHYFYDSVSRTCQYSRDTIREL